jgi:hypothetical protein
MAWWPAASIADIAALRASWGSVRGGWRAARQDAKQLLAHRRVLVDTQAMTPNGMQVVLRSRLRLSGDVETDILRAWLDATTPETVAASASEHFQAVAAAMGGWAAALGMERLATRLTIAIGSIAGAAATIRTVLASEPALLLHAVLTDWRLLAGFAFASLGVLIRWTLRWRLRSIFRGGLRATTSQGSGTRAR